MKLPIRKEYFDAIKNGKKHIEYRDAHITFVCEETGRALRKNITGICFASLDNLPVWLRESGMFKDNVIIKFELEKDTNIPNRK